jgi:hypothetical protein
MGTILTDEVFSVPFDVLNLRNKKKKKEEISKRKANNKMYEWE